jgi:hypothetical protein
MIKILQRKTDNKYLQSAETDTWVDNIKDAFEMTVIEFNNAKDALSGYQSEDLKEILIIGKTKNVSIAERKALRDLLK